MAVLPLPNRSYAAPSRSCQALKFGRSCTSSTWHAGLHRVRAGAVRDGDALIEVVVVVVLAVVQEACSGKRTIGVSRGRPARNTSQLGDGKGARTREDPRALSRELVGARLDPVDEVHLLP